MTKTDRDLEFMQHALKLAKYAYQVDEIPVGALLVKENKIVAKAFNTTKHNRLAHAEKLVIEQVLGEHEKLLYGYTLYTTLEPCTMCAAIIVLSRVGRVVFGASDPKAGGCGSVYDVLEGGKLNHTPEVLGGVLAKECGKILKEFFREKRE